MGASWQPAESLTDLEDVAVQCDTSDRRDLRSGYRARARGRVAAEPTVESWVEAINRIN